MTTTNRRLSGRKRKIFLFAHILSSAAWFGIDLALGILVLTALLTDVPETAGMALQAVGIFAVWPMFAASLVCLGTGVVLGLGSKYGLLRYWWVAVKLVVNVVMSVLIVSSLRTGVDDAQDLGARLLAGDPTAMLPTGLLLPPVLVSPTLLVIAFVLSVFKPWGRIQQVRKPEMAASIR